MSKYGVGRRGGIVDLITTTDRDATVVEAVFTAVDELNGGVQVASTGSAKRHPEDHYNGDVGVLLATGRALTDLGSKLQHIAWDKVHDEYGTEQSENITDVPSDIFDELAPKPDEDAEADWSPNSSSDAVTEILDLVDSLFDPERIQDVRNRVEIVTDKAEKLVDYVGIAATTVGEVIKPKSERR